MCIVSESNYTYTALTPVSQPFPLSHMPTPHHSLPVSPMSNIHQVSTGVESTMTVLVLGTIAPGQFSYYVAISVILLCAWFFRPSSKNDLSAPLYKASRRKWMFEADALIRDSYFKVSTRFPEPQLSHTNSDISLKTRSTRSRRPKGPEF